MKGRLTSIAELPMSKSTRLLNPHLAPEGVSPFTQSLIAEVAPTRKRLRQSSKPRLNPNENAFAAHLRDVLPDAFHYAQAIHLQLANGVRYTPDFATHEPLNHGKLTFWEVKGTQKIFDGAGEKLKIAAALFPSALFYLVWREAGAWQQQRILP